MRNHMFSFFMLYFQMQLHAFLVLKIVVFFLFKWLSFAEIYFEVNDSY